MTPTTLPPGAATSIQIPISAIEHHAYCPRQAGLILLEDGFEDDASTVRGTLLHQRVHQPDQEARPGCRVLWALPVWHDPLGLVGVCDAVELHADQRVLPVEHKSGPYVPGGPADLQAAAQAMCLEWMLGVPVPQAAVFSATDRRRHPIHLTATLRQQVITITEQVRATLTGTTLPPAVADHRCRRCSLRDACMPRLLVASRSYANAAAALFEPAAPAEEDAWDD